MSEEAVAIAVKLLKNFEGCSLRAYPDPASPLHEALVSQNLLHKFMQGIVLYKDLPEHFQELSGSPWTCGYGETHDVNIGDEWTQEEADSRLEARTREVAAGVLSECQRLDVEPPERFAACISLAYNIGLKGFSSSTVCRETENQDYDSAADAFMLWNKAQGKILDGLTKRRKIESDLYRSAR